MINFSKPMVQYIAAVVGCIILIIFLTENNAIYLSEIQAANRYRQLNNEVAAYPNIVLQDLKKKVDTDKITSKDIYTYFLSPKDEKDRLYDKLIDANPYKRDLYKEVLYLIECNKKFDSLSNEKQSVMDKINKNRKGLKHSAIYTIHKNDFNELYK